jgi:hypothetical protein
MEENLEQGYYNEKERFVKDLRKIFLNARTYNKPNTIYHKYAKDIENSLEDDMSKLKDR